MDNDKIAYALARIAMGISFFMHGLVRIPKLTEFAEGLANGFVGTLFPVSVAYGFGIILPFL